MSRKTTWKTFSFTDPNKYHRLQSSLHGLGEAKKYTVNWLSANYEIETNMPYSTLRTWFRFSDVPMQDHVADVMPLDERLKEWEKWDAEYAQKHKGK